jgi:hypothetical protein
MAATTNTQDDKRWRRPMAGTTNGGDDQWQGQPTAAMTDPHPRYKCERVGPFFFFFFHSRFVFVFDLFIIYLHCCERLLAGCDLCNFIYLLYNTIYLNSKTG